MNEAKKFTPIMEFVNEEHLQASIEEWKKILFLEDWVVKGIIVEPPLEDSEGCELAGQNVFQAVSKSSLIKVVRPLGDIKERIVKYCAEEVLVHELLHCKYNWLSKDYDSIEVLYYDTLEHALLEQMAKSLIMTKYNLSFEWFNNF